MVRLEIVERVGVPLPVGWLETEGVRVSETVLVVVRLGTALRDCVGEAEGLAA